MDTDAMLKLASRLRETAENQAREAAALRKEAADLERAAAARMAADERVLDPAMDVAGGYA